MVARQPASLSTSRQLTSLGWSSFNQTLSFLLSSEEEEMMVLYMIGGKTRLKIRLKRDRKECYLDY